MATLEKSLEKNAYEILMKDNAALVGAIHSLVDKGQTPRQIAKAVERHSGPFLASMVEMTAEYIRNEKASGAEPLA